MGTRPPDYLMSDYEGPPDEAYFAERALRVALVNAGHDAQTEDGADPATQARALANELKKYDAALFRKPRWLVFNKIDAVDGADEQIGKIVAALRWKRPWFKVSALTGDGCREVCQAVAREIAK